jgi:hypothetical protein
MALVSAVVGSAAFAAAAPAPAKESAPAAGTAAAKEPAKPAAPVHKELFWPELWGTFHKPTSWLSMGLDFRFRIEAGENWNTLNNANDTTDDWLYQRYRTRWWTKWTASEDITFNTRLTWETRTWQDPEARLQEPGGETVLHWNADEALFDWFNVNLRNLAGLPLTATIGRQDIIFGVGWLVLDGTPLDGSRTIHFEAARFTYDWADRNTKVDLIYVDQSAESDRWLEPINDQDRGLMEQDERGAILYVTNTSFKPTQLEGFFIYRNDNPIDTTLNNWPVPMSQKAEIYTVGAAVSGTPAEHWKYRAEGAFQTGDKTSLGGMEQDLQGYGALTTLEYLFKDGHDHATHVAYEYASGDDPSTSDNEQFDLLWGEWPRWSELLIYTAVFENQPAALTNLHRLNVGHRFNINKQWQLTGDYHALWADEAGAPWRTGAGGLNTSSSDRFRGHLLTSWLRYKFGDQLYGHFLAEYFVNAEEYFVSPSDDDAYFLRFNVEYIF